MCEINAGPLVRDQQFSARTKSFWALLVLLTNSSMECSSREIVMTSKAYNLSCGNKHVINVQLTYTSCRNMTECCDASCKSSFSNNSKGRFVLSTDNFRHSNLITHGQSEGHKVAVEHTWNRNQPPGQSAAEGSLQKLNESVFNKLRGEIKIKKHCNYVS